MKTKTIYDPSGSTKLGWLTESERGIYGHFLGSPRHYKDWEEADSMSNREAFLWDKARQSSATDTARTENIRRVLWFFAATILLVLFVKGCEHSISKRQPTAEEIAAIAAAEERSASVKKKSDSLRSKSSAESSLRSFVSKNLKQHESIGNYSCQEKEGSTDVSSWNCKATIFEEYEGVTGMRTFLYTCRGVDGDPVISGCVAGGRSF